MGADIFNSNSFLLNKDKSLSASLDISYSFPYTSVNSKYEDAFYTGIGLKCLLLKKQLSLGLAVNDLFSSNKQKWSEYTNQILSKSTNFENAPVFRFSISYKFGNTNLNIRNKKVGNSEDAGRAQ